DIAHRPELVDARAVSPGPIRGDRAQHLPRSQQRQCFVLVDHLDADDDVVPAGRLGEDRAEPRRHRIGVDSDPQHRGLASPASVRAERIGIDAVQTVDRLGIEELDLPRIAQDGLPRLGDGNRDYPSDKHLPEPGLEGADALAGRRGSTADSEGTTFYGAFVPVAGLLTGWSLIIAVGPQNALILRQGIRREHLGVVVGICILADVLLIGAGTVGIGAIVLLAPWALEVLRWLGVTYLLWFAWTSLRSARTASGLEADTHQRSLKSIVLTTLALTFLNPGVYLDTVVMLGN